MVEKKWLTLMGDVDWGKVHDTIEFTEIILYQNSWAFSLFSLTFQSDLAKRKRQVH